MAAITPSTNLKLLKNPNNLSNEHQLTFANATAQYTYFNSLTKIEVDDFTYQRKDYTIRYKACIDDILDYNYVMYQNSAYSNKWFYAYITNMRWVNDHVTEITITTDVYQTYMFDIIFKSSFVEREHVNNDTVGLHTIPEGLETGDYISCKLQPTKTSNIETCFVVAASEFPTGISSYSTLNQKLPLGLYYFGLEELSDVQRLVKMYDDAGQGDAVNSVFVIPKSFFLSWNTLSGLVGKISTSITFDYSDTYTVTTVNYLGNDYVPVNKKLLTYPYSFLQVSNHTGQIVNYRWENFNMLPLETTGINFRLVGTITPGGSFKLMPNNYNNILNNNDDCIVLGKYPIGAFTSDVYTNWLTQNGVNIAGIKLDAKQAGIAKGILQIGVGAGLAATGDVAGGAFMGTGAKQIFDAVQENYQHSLMPDMVEGNVNCGDINFTNGLNNFEFKRMSIKNEYASVIDNYFSMFGYKVTTVKVPNLTGRANWNYVKCIGANIEGLIPETYLNEIKNLFNNGITLWHNPNTFLDYSQSNAII